MPPNGPARRGSRAVAAAGIRGAVRSGRVRRRIGWVAAEVCALCIAGSWIRLQPLDAPPAPGRGPPPPRLGGPFAPGPALKVQLENEILNWSVYIDAHGMQVGQ